MPFVYEEYKPEFPPLLAPGLHPMSMADLRILCVDGFPLSKRRDLIMNGFEHVTAILKGAKVSGDLWVDGSFLTSKIDPDDCDVVLRAEQPFVDNATPDQQDVYTWFTDEFGELKKWLRCHCFPFIEYPAGHPLFWKSYWDHAYWVRQWGFSRTNVYKGIAVIQLT